MWDFVLRLLIVFSFPLWLCDSAAAASISVHGSLSLSSGAANDSASFAFNVSAANTVTIQSYGYGGSSNAPGGTNSAGRVIPAGGFDPYITLFSGSGASATFLASNDDGTCSVGHGALSNRLCGDSTLSLSLAPGVYTLIVGAFDNMSFAENLGTGTLRDGFIGLGNYDPLRTNNFSVDISGVNISGAPEMTISLAGLPTIAKVGTAYSGTFSCSNIGTADAVAGTICTITSGLPTGVTVGVCTISGGGTWVQGNLVSMGQTVTCSVAGTPTTIGTTTVNGSTGATGDSNLSDNTTSLGISTSRKSNITPVLMLLLD
jgi:hypothetical protein